jgi:hypothetical protein
MVTLRSVVLCWSVKTQPCLVTVPVPVKVVPLQQKRYAPVVVLNSATTLELESSCTQALKTVAAKLHDDVLPSPSVAVQVTVVVPGGKDEPLGGTHTVITVPQLSLAAGGG